MNWKRSALLILSLACLPWVSQARIDAVPLRAKQAKLIHIEVNGPAELRAMVESLLTEKGFVLVDDDQVPVLAVAGKKQTVGPARDCKVSYQITRATLRLPSGDIVYTFSNKSAYDYGSQDQAAASALYLLKAYLNQDDILLARLGEITPDAYYDLELPADPRDRKIDDIMEKVASISLALSPAANAARPSDQEQTALKMLAEEQKAIRNQIAEMADKMQAGQAAASEKAFLRLAAEIQAAAASQPPPGKPAAESAPAQPAAASPPGQQPAAECADDANRDYAAIGAVLIRVPIAGTQRLATGDYTVYGINGQCLYKRSKDQVGIRVAGSMTRLLGSSAGDYFRSPEGYLDINARQYAPAEGSIIVADCDAESMRKLGRANPDVFAKGRIFIVPWGPDRGPENRRP